MKTVAGNASLCVILYNKSRERLVPYGLLCYSLLGGVTSQILVYVFGILM